ncbi:MAG TPA: acyl-CoA dehydrogenase, partial [Porticoccaceae bacterium]|nr:acyl-CoA dehydrogenase [Porticoccaceae bacterium]
MAISYSAPVKDLMFLFDDVMAMQENFEHLNDGELATPDVVSAILSEAGKFCENELAPLYQSGDEGCIWDAGVVTTPTGFKEAYRKFVDAGWTSLSGDPAYGGQGLPSSIMIAVNEMLATSNWAWSMYPGLSEGAVATLEAHGTEAQKDQFLGKLISGDWSGTMCLTESHCGTDLGQMKTRAEPMDDGSYRINGTKIYISAGEHDLTDNIVHIVLAKIPDGPSGTKGISLFIIPKYLVAADGSVGERNGVQCGSIEKKMGIHGNATCVLHFEDATGFLIGRPHDGMQSMFTYMNVARIGTAAQGVAAAELSYQGASTYAKERLAMRSLSGVKNPDGPADPIIVHPDVRRMLLTQRAVAEGGRAMVVYASRFADIYRSGKTEKARSDAEARLGFCTPILKGFLTEMGFYSANLGVQVFGGHGYVREWGMEQIVRDSKISTLYEGTTGIQAIDLIGRKVLMDKFFQLKLFSSDIMQFAAQFLPWKRDPQFSVMWKKAAKLVLLTMKWRYLAMRVGARSKRNRDNAGAASVDFLMFSGYLYMAFMWAKMSLEAHKQLAEGRGDAEFLKAKIHTADFFFAKMLPATDALGKQILAPLDSV